MEKLERVELEAVLANARVLKRFAEELLEEVKRSSGSVDAERVKRLAANYGEVRNWVAERAYKIGLLMPYIEGDIFYYEFFSKPKLSLSRGEAIAVLQDVIRGCEVAERGLEALLRLHVEPRVLDELNSLRRELEELESRGLDPNIVKNLREAIAEAEQGHYLASAIIASRVICYVISKIPGERMRTRPST